MATMISLSATLKSFESSYASLSSVKSSQSEVSSAINDVSNQLDSAINGFTTASSDAQCAQLKASVSLVKSACSVVKSHVDGDIAALLGHADEVKHTIDEINEKIKQGSAMDEKILVKKKDPENGIPDDVYEDNKDVIRLNKEIELLNKKGEDQIKAMANALGGVSFGVAGNMKVGGSLGASVAYSDNYKFDTSLYEYKDDEAVPAGGEDKDDKKDDKDDKKDDKKDETDETVKEEDTDKDRPKFLGEKIGGRYANDWNDMCQDIAERWSHVDGIFSFVTGVVTSVYEAVDFVVEGVLDTGTAVVDSVNSGINWVLDGFNSRAGTTDEYWASVASGQEFMENWTTFGETHDFWSGLGNYTVGGLRTVVDAVQVVGNAVVTGVDWVFDNAAGSVLDAVGEALGFLHRILW